MYVRKKKHEKKLSTWVTSNDIEYLNEHVYL